MKEIIEAFAPSGEEGLLREVLTNRLRGKFDEIFADNMGNLVARSGNGRLCIECGMDSPGVMVVSKDEQGVRFSAVGDVKVSDVLERQIVFADGAMGKVCCDDEKTPDKAKISDLYIEIDGSLVEIGDFGAVSAEYKEEECAYTAFGLKNRIGLAAVCKALENTDEPRNITVLFSTQKRLGARGIQAFFRVNDFERIITVDKSTDYGFTIVAKDNRAVSNRNLRMDLETLADKLDVFAETVVSQDNFCLEQISISCGDPCAALGIAVLSQEGEPDRVNKSDYENAVSLLTGIIKSEG